MPNDPGWVQSALQFTFILPAALTIAGWAVVAGQADRREQRKDIRELLDDLRDRGNEMIQHASEYWLSPKSADDRPAAAALKADIKAISRMMREATRIGLRADCTKLLINLRTTATGGDFEASKRRRSSDDADRVMDIINAYEDLDEGLRAEFYDQFHMPKRWAFLRLLLLPLILLGLRGDRSV